MRTRLFIIVGLYIIGFQLSVSCVKLDYDTSNTHLFEAEETTEVFTKTASYYYFDEIVYVNQLTDRLFIQFESADYRNRFKNNLTSVSSLQPDNTVTKKTNKYGIDEKSVILIVQSMVGDIPSKLLSEIESEDGVVCASYLCGRPDGLYAPTNQLMVKLKEGVSLESFVKFSNLLGCKYRFDSIFGDRTLFVEKSKSCGFDLFELSKLFHDSGLLEYAAPDFCRFDVLLSDDRYYSYQWGLKNTGQHGPSGIDINIEQAWSITQGSSDIKIAVVDTGVELTHPDLVGNLLVGYDATNQTSGGADVDYDGHGTAVSGIIAAIKDNEIGIAGVAPLSKILPVRMFGDTYGYDSDFARGINWAWQNGADIINCSWGWSVGTVFPSGSPNAGISSAINNANTYGRDGKGCVVIVSSGNNNSNVCYPAILNNVLSVGALSYEGKRKSPQTDTEKRWGSCYGGELDVVAPGVYVPTTDLSGLYGLNPPTQSSETYPIPDVGDKSYSVYFSGTSAAAPYVSGIAALILSKFPDLTESQVRRAIELSCTKLSGYTYYSDSEYPPGARNNEVGYGLVNAYMALRKASEMHQQNVHDAIPGFDYIINNGSSYLIDEVYVELNGTISGVSNTLIASDPGGIFPEGVAGYPVYLGEDLDCPSGTAISDIVLDLYATIPDYAGNIMIGVSIDNPTPTFYYNYAFGDGNTYSISLPNTTVPSRGNRRMLYINIIDPR